MKNIFKSLGLHMSQAGNAARPQIVCIAEFGAELLQDDKIPVLVSGPNPLSI